MARTAKKKLRILDDGILLAEDADSLDFSGSGVEGSVLGNDVTETIDNDGTVDTDASITGDGSVGDPLEINLAHSNHFTTNQSVTYTSDNDTEVTAFQVNFNKDIALVNTDYGFASIYAGIQDSSNISGEIEDKVLQKSGFEVGVFLTGDSTVNWIDGSESIRGYTSYVYHSGTFSGAKHDVDMIGHDMTVLNQASFSNDGTHLHRIFGNKINVLATGTVSIDAFVTRKAYGEYIEVSIADTGDVNEAYGIYIKDVFATDAMYAIYSETTALSHFEGDVEVADEVYGSGWDGSLEVPTKNAMYDKIQTVARYVGVPASAGASGVAGEVSYDASFWYVCTAANTWKRVAIATW